MPEETDIQPPHDKAVALHPPCSVSGTPRVDKAAWKGLIGQMPDGKLAVREVINSDAARELERELVAWRNMAGRLRATLALNAYNGYKQVADVLRDYASLNDKLRHGGVAQHTMNTTHHEHNTA